MTTAAIRYKSWRLLTIWPNEQHTICLALDYAARVYRQEAEELCDLQGKPLPGKAELHKQTLRSAGKFQRLAKKLRERGRRLVESNPEGECDGEEISDGRGGGCPPVGGPESISG